MLVADTVVPMEVVGVVVGGGVGWACRGAAGAGSGLLFDEFTDPTL